MLKITSCLFCMGFVLSVGILSTGCAPRFSSHDIGHGKVTTLSYDADWRAATILYRPSNDPAVLAQIVDEIKKLAPLDGTIRENTPSDTTHKQNAVKNAIIEKGAIQARIATLNAMTSRPFVLAEPPPQIKTNFDFGLKGSVEKIEIGELALRTQAQKLFEVAGYNLAIRDALYRLNEAYAFGGLSEAQYTTMFASVMTAATTMSSDHSKALIAAAGAKAVEKDAREELAAARAAKAAADDAVSAAQAQNNEQAKAAARAQIVQAEKAIENALIKKRYAEQLQQNLLKTNPELAPLIDNAQPSTGNGQ